MLTLCEIRSLMNWTRRELGHGTGTRHVRIHRDGRITYWGSPEDTDRQHDYKHDGGHVMDRFDEWADAFHRAGYSKPPRPDRLPAEWR